MANLPPHVVTEYISVLSPAFRFHHLCRNTLLMIVAHHSFVPTLIDLLLTVLASGNQQRVHEIYVR